MIEKSKFLSVTQQQAKRMTNEHFYHWGALLGMIKLIEQGYVLLTEKSINH
jgi:hypothetical protein